MHDLFAKFYGTAVTPRLRVLRLLPLAGAPLIAVLVLVNLALGLLPVAFILAASAIVGRAPAAIMYGTNSRQWDSLVLAFTVATGVFLAQQLLAPLQSALGERVQHRVNGHIYRRLMVAALRTTDMAALEEEATLDKLHQAREVLENATNTPGHAVSGMVAYIARYTRLLGFVLIIAVVASPWGALLIFMSTMCFRYGQRGSGLRVLQKLFSELNSIRRERDYYRSLGMQATSAKEIRVFGLIEWTTDRFRAKARENLEGTWKVRRRVYIHRFVWFTVIGLVIDCTVLALLVRAAAQGGLTLTELALGMQSAIAAILLGELYYESDPKTQFGMSAMSAIEEFEAIIDARVERNAAPGGATVDAAGRPHTDIRFANVSFMYGGSSRSVLDGLELTLRGGECTAIVGLNGAGKTTLVKLLTRLYEPSTGAVLVDGVDVRTFDVDSWRRQVGVIFQDFNRYQLSVTDNIAFGAIQRPATETAVRAAASKSRITEALDALPRGFATMLARQYESGAELSGGQWQRVAIARALYAVDAGARVLVLDEPTAALDVRAEAAFFDEFASLTRGLTTVLISHRFSSVRKADRIVVLEHGRVVEDGTHDFLIQLRGRYAEMFRLQAERFTEVRDSEQTTVRDSEVVGQ